MFDLYDGHPVKRLFIYIMSYRNYISEEYKRYQGFYWTTKTINEILP